MDGNGKSFVVFGALTLNETAATYTWVFETAKKLLGTMACTAVHYIVSDDDHGEKSALMRKVCIRGRSACGFICAELHNISHNCKKKKSFLHRLHSQMHTSPHVCGTATRTCWGVSPANWRTVTLRYYVRN